MPIVNVAADNHLAKVLNILDRNIPSSFFYNNISSFTIVQGKDALKHLERILTTKISKVGTNSKHESLICDSNGRIVDYLSIYIMDDKVLIVTNNHKGDEIRSRLSKGIPWNEDVEILNGDNSIKRIIVSENDLNKILESIDYSVEEIDDSTWIEDGDNIISINKRSKVKTLELLLPKTVLSDIIEEYQKNDIKEINEEEWKKFRIYTGMIDFSDIVGRIPFDVGMDELVKMDKGCYPGQEIHARLESRGKQKKILVTLKSGKFLKEGEYKIIEGGRVIITTAYNGGKEESLFFGIVPIKYLKMSKLSLINGIEMRIENVVNFRSLNVHH